MDVKRLQTNLFRIVINQPPKNEEYCNTISDFCEEKEASPALRGTERYCDVLIMGKDQKILKVSDKSLFFLLRSEASPSLRELKDVAHY